LDVIRCIRLREWDFFNENHKDLTIWQGAFGDPALFFVGGIERPAFLEQFYARKVVEVDGIEKWARVR
jgi:hypothetical protein